MRLIIVEDEIRIREGIRKLIPKLDEGIMIVGEAENGEQGLELICCENPDVIITDVKMPVMDGLEMLEQAYAEGCMAKAIILSAYSEFEYARSALRLGVTEYLLKPCNMHDYATAIARVKAEIEKGREQKPERIGSLDQLVRNILSGDLEPDDAVMEYMGQKFGLYREKPLSLLVTYFEEWEEKKVVEFSYKIKQILAEKPEILYCIQEDKKKKEVRLFLYNYRKDEHMKRWIQGHFLKKSKEVHGVAMGWTEVPDICELKENYDQVEHYLEWSIPLGDEIVIPYPEIRNVQTEISIYPLEIEEEMKLAVCSGNQSKIERSAGKFHAYFQDRKLYEPKNIKECYVRFFWAMMSFSRETGNTGIEEISHRELLERISQTRTRQGLRNVSDEILRRMEVPENQIENLNVKRTVAMIHEFYRTGITLEEIASKLSITPEYLGTQFRREMGLTFSTYIKKVRIDKAKKLLIGTGLKLYEIAEQVGYVDPKYFGKVFKAETGQLPADYRRSHK